MDGVYLAYGDSGFRFQYEASRFDILTPAVQTRPERWEHLIESPPIEHLSANKRVLVIVSDITRPTGASEFLPGLIGRMRGAAGIRFLFATGLHRPLSGKDKAAIVGSDVVERYPMLDHEPDRNNVLLGTTSFGNQVELDHEIQEHDLIVLTGAIGFHYFAGFTGGRKSLLPGIASEEAIRFNHLLVLDPAGRGRNPDVRVARMAGNPVNDDMIEAARMVEAELFVYNTILGPQREILKVFSGNWLAAHQQGAADYLAAHSVDIPQTRALAIVSCGGFPRDINLIQSHKALEFAQYCVEPGGTIVLLAECREGAGHADFLKWFRHQDLDEFEQRLKAGYEVYGQTAYAFRSKTERFRVICVSSVEDATIHSMGMEPAEDLASALAKLDPNVAGADGYILPFGAEVLPRLQSSSTASPEAAALA